MHLLRYYAEYSGCCIYSAAGLLEKIHPMTPSLIKDHSPKSAIPTPNIKNQHSGSPAAPTPDPQRAIINPTHLSDPSRLAPPISNLEFA